MSLPLSFRDQLSKHAEHAGFTLAGIAPVPLPAGLKHEGYFEQWVEAGHAGEMEYLKRRDEARLLLRSSLETAFPWARSIIVCAANYHADAPLSVEPAPVDAGWIARYAWSGQATPGSGAGHKAGPETGHVAGHVTGNVTGDEAGDEAGNEAGDSSMLPSDYHDILLPRLRVLEGALLGWLGPMQTRCYVDTGPIVERAYAHAAGIGWTGKNTCVINQQAGSWLLLGVIVTSYQLLPPQQLATLPPDRCGSCRRCIEACPTDALIAPYQMDASRCIAYLTIEKRGAIAGPLRAGMGRQVFGCDICQDVCPWNRRAAAGQDAGLAPRPELVNPSLSWLAGLDAQGFNKLFRGSPVQRTKLAGLRRNVAIAMGNSGQSQFLPQLEEWTLAGDDTLRETAAWARQQILAAISQPATPAS